MKVLNITSINGFLTVFILIHPPWGFSYLVAETSNRKKIDDPGRGLSVQGLKRKRRKSKSKWIFSACLFRFRLSFLGIHLASK